MKKLREQKLPHIVLDALIEANLPGYTAEELAVLVDEHARSEAATPEHIKVIRRGVAHVLSGKPSREEIERYAAALEMKRRAEEDPGAFASAGVTSAINRETGSDHGNTFDPDEIRAIVSEHNRQAIESGDKKRIREAKKMSSIIPAARVEYGRRHGITPSVSTVRRAIDGKDLKREPTPGS